MGSMGGCRLFRLVLHPWRCSVFLRWSSPRIKRALIWLWEGLMRLLGTGSSGSEGALLLVIAVGVIVLPAVIYFARTYAELRRLEAVGIICALAASGSAQQHAGSSDAVQPAADARNDTGAAPASPAVSGDGSSDVPALSGDLHSDTLSEPNAPAVSGDGAPDVPAPSGDFHSDTLSESNAPAALASGSPDADLSAAGVSTSSAALTLSDAPGDPSKPANPGS